MKPLHSVERDNVCFEAAERAHGNWVFLVEVVFDATFIDLTVTYVDLTHASDVLWTEARVLLIAVSLNFSFWVTMEMFSRRSDGQTADAGLLQVMVLPMLDLAVEFFKLDSFIARSASDRGSFGLGSAQMIAVGRVRGLLAYLDRLFIAVQASRAIQ